jgi:hypothetical protein
MIKQSIKYFIIVLGLFFVSSCHKKFASFQSDSFESFSSKKDKKEIISQDEKVNKLVNEESKIEPFDVELEVSEPIILDDKLEDEPFWKRKKKKTESKKGIFKKKESPNKKKKKRKRINPMYNDSLKIGTVFLLITAVLGIIGLSGQIIWVFALASVLFLYLGLKKYLLRKRFQRVFKK